VTDGQTDRIPIANTRSQQYLPVQLSRVKTYYYYYYYYYYYTAGLTSTSC